MVELLAGAGADTRATDVAGYTALHYACSGGHTAAAGSLLRRGADIKWVALRVEGNCAIAKYTHVCEHNCLAVVALLWASGDCAQLRRPVFSIMSFGSPQALNFPVWLTHRSTLPPCCTHRAFFPSLKMPYVPCDGSTILGISTLGVTQRGVNKVHVCECECEKCCGWWPGKCGGTCTHTHTSAHTHTHTRTAHTLNHTLTRSALTEEGDTPAALAAHHPALLELLAAVAARGPEAAAGLPEAGQGGGAGAARPVAVGHKVQLQAGGQQGQGAAAHAPQPPDASASGNGGGGGSVRARGGSGRGAGEARGAGGADAGGGGASSGGSVANGGALEPASGSEGEPRGSQLPMGQHARPPRRPYTSLAEQLALPSLKKHTRPHPSPHARTRRLAGAPQAPRAAARAARRPGRGGPPVALAPALAAVRGRRGARGSAIAPADAAAPRRVAPAVQGRAAAGARACTHVCTHARTPPAGGCGTLRLARRCSVLWHALGRIPNGDSP